MRFYIFTSVGLFCVSFFIYTPPSLDVFKRVLLCDFMSENVATKRHFSIFELFKSSFIEADVINYILIHVNRLN